MPADDDKEKIQLRSRVRDLELALGQGNENLAVTFRLTPVLNNLMGLVLSQRIVTPEMIRQRLEIAPDAKVAICRLRKAIEPWGLEIKSRRNVGYWFEDEAKAKIRALMDDGASPSTPSTLVSPAAPSEVTDDGGPEDDLLDKAVDEALAA